MKHRRLVLDYVMTGALALFAIFLLIHQIKQAIAESNGEPVKAVVVKLPKKCSRNASIQVQYLDNTYKLTYTGKRCWDDLYNPGDTISAAYYEPFDILLWANQRSGQKMLLFFIPFIILTGFIFRAYFKKQKKKEQAEACQLN